VNNELAGRWQDDLVEHGSNRGRSALQPLRNGKPEKLAYSRLLYGHCAVDGENPMPHSSKRINRPVEKTGRPCFELSYVLHTTPPEFSWEHVCVEQTSEISFSAEILTLSH